MARMQQASMDEDRLAAWTILLLALAQFLAPAFSAVTGIGRGIPQLASLDATPVTPADRAFAIWGVIFAGFLVYGVWRLLPAGRASKLARRLDGPVALALLGNTAWMIAAQALGNGPHLMALILVVLGASLTALFRALLHQTPYSGTERWLAVPLLGLLAGWVTAASFAQVASLVGAQGDAAVLLIGAAGLAGFLLTIASGGSLPYALALLWALGAIAVRNLGAMPQNRPAAIAAAFAAALVAVALARARLRAEPSPRRA